MAADLPPVHVPEASVHVVVAHQADDPDTATATTPHGNPPRVEPILDVSLTV